MRLKNSFFLFTLFTFSVVHSLAQDVPDSVKNDSVLTKDLDVRPSFPGGLPAWSAFLRRNLDARTPMNNGAPTGKYTVQIKFTVDKEGNASNAVALTNHGYGMEQEVMRLIKIAGKWTPGQQKGRIVNTYMIQPVTFVIQPETVELYSDVLYTFYTGKENKLTILPLTIKKEEMSVTISKGHIEKKEDGKYSITVNEPGKVVITILGKENKKIESISFDVKPPAE